MRSYTRPTRLRGPLLRVAALEEALREAHVPTEQPEAEEDPRVPDAHADARGPGGAHEAPAPGPEAALSLTGRVRDRATFEALGRARRFRRGPFTLRFVPPPSGDDEVRVAYAVGRSVGGAVRRNRVRRRLRAAVAGAHGEMPAGAYLFGAGPEAVTMPFSAIDADVRELVDAARPAQ